MDLHYLFSTVFDCLFPPSGEALVVKNMSETTMSSFYSPQVVDSIHVLSAYNHPHMRALIHEAKFHHNTRAWVLLNILFNLHLAKMSEPIDYIIPVPLSSARMRARGYNQVTEILKANQAENKYQILENVLVRTRHTIPQTELARDERLANMHDAFGVVHGERIMGKHILLVDDVTTTGSTLRAAKAALEKYNIASITCIAIAH